MLPVVLTTGNAQPAHFAHFSNRKAAVSLVSREGLPSHSPALCARIAPRIQTQHQAAASDFSSRIETQATTPPSASTGEFAGFENLRAQSGG